MAKFLKFSGSEIYNATGDKRNIITKISITSYFKLTIYAINDDTGNIISDFSRKVTDGKEYLETLPEFIVVNTKLMIVSITGIRNASESNYPVLLKLREDLKKLNIPLMVIPFHYTTALEYILGAKVQCQTGDQVLVLATSQMKCLLIRVLKKDEGFIVTEHQAILFDDKKYKHLLASPEAMKKGIIGSVLPKRILLYIGHDTNPVTLKALKAGVKSRKLVTFEGEGQDFRKLVILEIGKWFKDHAQNEYRFLPQAIGRTVLSKEDPLERIFDGQVVVEPLDVIPVTKEILIPRTSKDFHAYCQDVGSLCFRKLATTNPPQGRKYHKIRLVMEMDENNFVSLTSQPAMIDKILNLIPHLDKTCRDSYPVIGFFDNSSVICVKGQNGYEFMEHWGGIYGKDLYISFSNNNFPIGDEAREIKDTCPRFVFYDLIKLIATHPQEVIIDPEWGFKIVSTPEQPVLIELDTYEQNNHYMALPDLMQLMIQGHLRGIQEAMFILPDKLYFCLFDEFTKDQADRVKSTIQKACEAIQLNFEFIDI